MGGGEWGSAPATPEEKTGGGKKQRLNLGSLRTERALDGKAKGTNLARWEREKRSRAGRGVGWETETQSHAESELRRGDLPDSLSLKRFNRPSFPLPGKRRSINIPTRRKRQFTEEGGRETDALTEQPVDNGDRIYRAGRRGRGAGGDRSGWDKEKEG